MSVMSRRQPIHRCFSCFRDDVRLVGGRSAGTYRGDPCEDINRRLIEVSLIEEADSHVEDTRGNFSRVALNCKIGDARPLVRDIEKENELNKIMRLNP